MNRDGSEESRGQKNHKKTATLLLLAQDSEPYIVDIFAKADIQVSNLTEMLLFLPSSDFVNIVDFFESKNSSLETLTRI